MPQSALQIMTPDTQRHNEATTRALRDNAPEFASEWLEGHHQGNAGPYNYLFDGAYSWNDLTDQSILYPTDEEIKCLDKVASQLKRDVKEKFIRDSQGRPLDLNNYPLLDIGTGNISKLLPFIKYFSSNVVVVDISQLQLDIISNNFVERRKAAGREITVRPILSNFLEPDDYGKGPFFSIWGGLHFGNAIANPLSDTPPIEHLLYRSRWVCNKTKNGVVLISFNHCLDPDKNKRFYEGREHEAFNLAFLDRMVSDCGFPQDVRDCFEYEAISTVWQKNRKPVASMVSRFMKVNKNVSTFEWRGKRFSFEKGERRLIECSVQTGTELMLHIGKSLGKVLRCWSRADGNIGLMLIDMADTEPENIRPESFSIKAKDFQKLAKHDPSKPIFRNIPRLSDYDLLLNIK
jgi:hypothetical protein